MSLSAGWDPALYSRNTAHHRAYDDHILGPVAISADFRILDLGSGAGDLTAKLATLVPDGSVTGIDASLELVQASRQRFRDADNVEFRHLRAQQLAELGQSELPSGRKSGPPFDLAISVATLHWVPRGDHLGVYRALFNLLKESGRFRADFGGAGQILEVRKVLNATSSELGGAVDPWYFADEAEVEAMLIESGFELDDGFVRLVPQRRSVPDVEAFIEWLDSQVLIAYRMGLPEGTYEAFRRSGIERLVAQGPREDGSFDQDYIRMDVLATKPRR